LALRVKPFNLFQTHQKFAQGKDIEGLTKHYSGIGVSKRKIELTLG